MANSPADRNLLFGILAVQMDFISRDQLIAAMNAWVLAKEKPLGQVLQDQNALSSERHILLEALVKEHLKQHENDPEKSLAALSSAGSLRQDLALGLIADPDVQASMAQIGVSRGNMDDPNATASFIPGTSTGTGLRFRIVRFHAKGGLGEVFVAKDEELHREVALKEIQNRHADDPSSRARFLLEAEITGGLEHPGIVPVYGLGQYADGRPFYAMRFIRGDSLKGAIDRFYKGESAPSATGERALEFRKLLGRFIDVCQAMQYAHDRGILHRDLKPGNIMLGKYGETLVVDWGLAKAVGKVSEPERQRGANDEAMLRPTSASGSAETVAGTALGTPAFMSPEQAAGRLDLLGPASDVYSLGATLYCLLTGKQPIEDKDVAEVLRKVRNGEFPKPRQRKPNIDPALEAICLKAMALEQSHRYASPLAMADDIEHWLADEPVGAHREPVIVQARRWARKHKPLVWAVAALLIVVLPLLTIGLALLQLEKGKTKNAVDLASSERKLATTTEYFNLINTAFVRRMESSLGWRSKCLDNLKKAGELDVPEKDMVYLRSEAASCLGGVDFQLKHSIKTSFQPRRVAFSPDGKLLAIAQTKGTFVVERDIRIVDVETGERICDLSYPGPGPLQINAGGTSGGAMTFSPKGTWLVLGSKQGKLHIWNLKQPASKRIDLQGHDDEITGVAFKEADEKADTHFFTCSKDQHIKRWQFSSDKGKAPAWKMADSKSTGYAFVNMSYSKGLGRLVCGTTKGVALLLPDLKKLGAAETYDSRPVTPGRDYQGATSHDGGILVFHLREKDKKYRITDPALNDKAHRGSITNLEFSPDRSLLITSADDLRIWEVPTRRLLVTIGTKFSESVVFALSPDGRHMAVVDEDATLLYHISGLAEQRFIGSYLDPISGFDFTPEGGRIACPASKDMRYWILKTGSPLDGPDLQPLPDHRKSYVSIHPKLGWAGYNLSSAYIALVDRDKTNKAIPKKIGDPMTCLAMAPEDADLWLEDGPEVAAYSIPDLKKRIGFPNLMGAKVYSISPRKTLVAVSFADRSVIVFRAKDAVGVRGWTSPSGPIHSVSLNGAETLIAAGAHNGDVFLVPVKEGQPALKLKEHVDLVESVAFSPGDEYLATAGRDRRVRLYQRSDDTYREILSLQFPGPLIHVRFSPDGKKLGVLGESEYSVRLWDLDALRSSLRQMNLDW